MLYEIKHIFNIIIIFQLTLFSIFLFTRRNEGRCRNQILAVFLLSIAIITLGHVFDHYVESVYLHLPHLFYIDFPFYYLYPPLLFLYTQSLTDDYFTLKGKRIRHFIPFLVFLTLIIFKYHIHGVETVRHMLTSGPRSNPIFSSTEGHILTSMQYLQFFVYAAASLARIGKYQSALKRVYSSTDRIYLNWMKLVVVGFLMRDMGNLMQYLYGILADRYSIVLHIAIQVFTLVFSSVLVIKGVRHTMIIPGLNGNLSGPKYAKSLLSQSERNRHLQKLLNYMEAEKPFLDPSINLHSLAKSVAVSPHYLSQVLNEALNQNFFDFINSYRIKESQRLLRDPQYKKNTVLEILYEVGFNSKSVFNSAFKKQTGMTPTEFRKSYA